MKVLYLLNFAGKAGTERYVESLARYLGPQSGGPVEPYFAYNTSGLLVERLEAMGVPTRQLAMDSRFDFKAAKALAELCREWDIDLIHCHFLRENYIALLAKGYYKKLRVVYTNHFILANDRITRLSNRLLDRRQDRMIAVCRKGKEQLVANGWSGGKIHVVHNGVDPDAWADDVAPPTLRSELGLPEDRFVMLCASRFAHDKGHDYLVRSMAALARVTQVPFTLVLAGDGELLEPTQALCGRLGLGEDKVRFIGFRKDMKNLFKSVDLYINSSQHEALSFLIIEAMAAGLPAAITDMAGNPDILTGPDQGGVLLPYNDPEETARRLAPLLEDPAFLRRCRESAQKNIRDRFDIRKLAQETYEIYQKAVEV